MSTDVAEVRTLLANRSAALAAGDAAAAVATTAAGAVTYDLAPPLHYVHDRDAAIAGIEGWLAGWTGPIANELVDPTVIVSGDLAVAYGFARLRGLSKSGGAHDSWYRATVVLERGPGGWQIRHEHLSYPMRMDGSERAATDLTPEQ